MQSASTATKTRPTANRALQAAVGLGVIGFGLAYAVLQLLTAGVRLK